jgi:hypothetical protein
MVFCVSGTHLVTNIKKTGYQPVPGTIYFKKKKCKRMIISYKGWKNIFLLCLGIFAGTGFCMKWVEGDFVQNGSLFTIIGLEISYPKEQVSAILSGLDGPVKTILRYHLCFDFAFMLGVYPGIAALCRWPGIK